MDTEQRVQAKTPIEEAVLAHLGEQQRGALVASGTGLRYAYLDVALASRDRGVAELRELLRGLDVPKRSWIQFFESHLAGEWVGIHPDTPPPPAPEPGA